jgi:predicted nucleic acid-binding protein
LKLVVDTYAWIELFSGSLKGKKVQNLIHDAEEIVTPSIVLAEFAKKYLRDKLPESDLKHRLGLIHSMSHTIDLTTDLAVASAKAYFEMLENTRKKKIAGSSRPGLADGIILATTRMVHGKVVSGDPHFENLPDTIWI